MAHGTTGPRPTLAIFSGPTVTMWRISDDAAPACY
jgi:hypothetical protein